MIADQSFADAADAPSGAAVLASKLAAGFADVVTGILEEIHRYAGEQVRIVARSLEDQIRQSQDELWGAVRGLREADEAQCNSVEQVSAEIHELSHQLSSQVDAVASRFEAVEKRASVLEWLVHEIEPQLSRAIAEVDAHTGALRTLEQRQTQRVATLNQVLDSLAKLKEQETPELAAAAQA